MGGYERSGVGLTGCGCPDKGLIRGANVNELVGSEKSAGHEHFERGEQYA